MKLVKIKYLSVALLFLLLALTSVRPFLATVFAATITISDCTELQALDAGSGTAFDTYTLTQDIDCSGIVNFTPLGTNWGDDFHGTFDGGGFTISNLTISHIGDYRVGLFVSAKDAVFKDVTFDGGSILGSDTVGTLVGWAMNVTIDNVHSNLDIAASASGSGIGGLVGELDANDGSSLVTDSSATGDVSGRAWVGGLVGASFIVDQLRGTVTISRSSATGTVTATSPVGYREGFGGLVGHMQIDSWDSAGTPGSYAMIIQDSYATGDVNGRFGTGGLVGYIDLTHFTSYDPLTDLSTSADVSILRSYAAGTLSADDDTGGALGGLIGYLNDLKTNESLAIEDSFVATTFLPIGTPLLGPVFGRFDEDTYLGYFPADSLNNYFDADRAGMSSCTYEVPNEFATHTLANCTAVNVGGGTPNYFKNNSTNPPFDQWDFTTVWEIITADYPGLRAPGSVVVPPPVITPPPSGGDTGGSTGDTGSTGGNTTPTKKKTVPAPTSTPIEPAEPKLSVNLTEGQVITGKYTVVVSPLPDNTGSYDNVEFYLDDKLLSTFRPDGTGNASWVWDTTSDSGSRVRVVAYRDGTAITTWRFTVKIENKTETPVVIASTPKTGWLLSIPFGIALALPYLLILLLFVLVAMLLYQSYREAMTTKRLLAAYQRAQKLADEKDGFIALASHYLRTPLTLIEGGVDMLSTAQPPASQNVLAGLATATKAFGSSIEAILSRVTQNSGIQLIVPARALPPPPKTIKSPLFWVPLVAIGPAVVFFNSAFIKASVYGLGFVNTAAQVLLFAILAAGLYIAVRGLAISKHNKRTAEQQTAQQLALDDARNQLIYNSVDTLTVQLEKIKNCLLQVPPGVSEHTIREGCNRVTAMLARFRAIAAVAPIPAAAPFVGFTSDVLIGEAQQQTATVAQEKRIRIASGANLPLASQKPAWVADIVESLLDNAIAYSPVGSQVAVNATLQGDSAIITVQDHGQGIPQDKLNELFQPFAKAEGPMQFDHPGIGLSLYFSRLLATSLGGTIRMTSEVGSGTTVTISFPTR